MAGQKQELPVSGEPLAVESPMTNKKKKKSKKNKHTEENHEVEEVPQEVTNGVEEELSNKEKKKKRKREEKESEKNKKKDVPEKKLEAEDLGEGESEQQKVVVTGKGVEEAKYAALKTFAESNLPENVLDCCKTFEKPSPIQSHTWPFLLDGRDLIGIAKTGSGKTLAFGIPAIMHVLKKNKKIGGGSKKVNPTCLVLSPTRELAVQISDVLREAGEPCGLKSICVYGGSSKGPQISAIRSGVDIVIGTPGRLRDLIESNVLRLSDVSFVVLDEADRMLDMGFEEPVRFILSNTNKVRQMVMFSATWPLDVHKLAQEFMDPNPIKVCFPPQFVFPHLQVA
jgi:ATP-dependent RNA helicase DBP3